MATLSEYIQKVKNARDQLLRTRKTLVLLAVNDGLGLLKLRIQTGGEDADGGKFDPYTSDYALYGRTNKGYQKDYVDFTRTGRMWANVQPFVLNESIFSTTIEIRARDAENQAKLDGQFSKRGNILELSKEEEDLLSELNRKRVLEAIKEIL